ncbi:hypothetical protein PIB30_053687 [Stylosanthes scabra]|uniref:Uncharacterized protein n=1 Tax=Stylosanthes scabra TaxID=79078 RepID=A0ABU6WJ21_9FABA|nr:hypothetical protein [Stylosanthes scabra]
MRDSELEGDYVLEAARPSDRVYQELFMRLGVTFPLTDFQRSMLSRCKVAVSQLHLNGWGFLRAFERVFLHFGFRPTARLFLYIYDAFWLDDEGSPFPWVYWNPNMKDFTVFNLDLLETAACKFLLSLPADSLLEVKMKQNRLDKLRAQMADISKMGPRSILPTTNPANIPVAVSSAVAGTSSSIGVAASPIDIVLQPSPSITTRFQKKVPPGTICLETEVALRGLGEDSTWEHDVHPVDLAFPDTFDYRKAIDGEVASSSVCRALVKMAPE